MQKHRKNYKYNVTTNIVSYYYNIFLLNLYIEKWFILIYYT